MNDEVTDLSRVDGDDLIHKCKLCSKCGQLKSLDEYHTDRQATSGKKAYCKKCGLIIKKISYHKHQKARRASARAKELPVKYGITSAQYAKLYHQQDGLCAICGQPEHSTYKGIVRMLAVDHDHVTRKVRGLLCARCNLILGYIETGPCIENFSRYLNNGSCNG